MNFQPIVSVVFGGIVGAAIGTVFLVLFVTFDVQSVVLVSSQLATIFMPIIAIIGFAYLKKQINVTHIPNKREAYFHLQQDQSSANLIGSYPEEKMISLFIASLETRAGGLEGRIKFKYELEQIIDDVISNLNVLNPKVVIYLSQGEQEARHEVVVATRNYLSRGIGMSYSAYENRFGSEDDNVIKGLLKIAQKHESQITKEMIETRLNLRKTAIEAEERYSLILERRMDENVTH